MRVVVIGVGPEVRGEARHLRIIRAAINKPNPIEAAIAIEVKTRAGSVIGFLIPLDSLLKNRPGWLDSNLRRCLYKNS
jgi:hypothetical protein